MQALSQLSYSPKNSLKLPYNISFTQIIVNGHTVKP